MSEPGRASVEQITSTLIRVINKIQQDRRLPRDFGKAGRLTLLEAHVCSIVARRPGLTGSELSVEIGVTRSATSQTVTKLKAKGLVRETTDRADAKRRKHLFLTKLGQQAAAIADGYLTIFSREIFEEPQEELDAYLRFLAKIESFQETATERLADPDHGLSS